MTTHAPSFLQGGSYGAADFRYPFGAIFGAPLPGTLALGSIGGVVNGGDCVVTQNGTPNMSVNVAGGQVVIPGTTAANQGLYFGLNDASINVPISASNPTNPRIDDICGTVNDAAYAGASNNWTVQAITGTPAASPVAPSLPVSSTVFAHVAVAANATTVVTANITDERTFALIGGGQKIANNSDTGWVNLSLINSWANVGGVSPPASIRRQGNIVRLRGAIDGGANTTSPFVVPAGYTPPAAIAFPAFAYDSGADTNTGGYVSILAAGTTVIVYGAGTNQVFLDGITWTID